MTSSLFFSTILSIIFHVCKSSIFFLLERCQCFYLIFLGCWNVVHYILIRKIVNCVIQFSNSGLKKARQIIRILYFLNNADVSNKFDKFQCFNKKDNQQSLFTHLKLNVSETRKNKTENSI